MRTQLDPLTVHSADIGEIVGAFYGTPIRTWNRESTERREREDATLRIAQNRLAEIARAEEATRENSTV